MEFKSTLEKKSKEFKDNAKRMKDAGMTVPPLIPRVNEMIKDSPKFSFTLDTAIDNAATIQPSIGEEDLRIAVCLQLTLCSQLVYNLIEANLIKIVE